MYFFELTYCRFLPLCSVSGLNFSKLQTIETSVDSSPATAVGIVVGAAAVITIVIIAAFLKMWKRGGSHTFGTDGLEYSKLVE
jgi:hypothetical protein